MKVIVVEQDRCMACRNCERVCSFKDPGGPIHEKANIWVHIDMNERIIFTMTCQQCETASCLEICPAGAIFRDLVTGAVVVNNTLCVGCRMCVNACPFGYIHFDEIYSVAAKCDLCKGDPKCVKNCMAKALHYCDINDLAAGKRERQLFKQPGYQKEHIEDEG